MSQFHPRTGARRRHRHRDQPPGPERVSGHRQGRTGGAGPGHAAFQRPGRPESHLAQDHPLGDGRPGPRGHRAPGRWEVLIGVAPRPIPTWKLGGGPATGRRQGRLRHPDPAGIQASLVILQSLSVWQPSSPSAMYNHLSFRTLYSGSRSGSYG